MILVCSKVLICMNIYYFESLLNHGLLIISLQILSIYSINNGVAWMCVPLMLTVLLSIMDFSFSLSLSDAAKPAELKCTNKANGHRGGSRGISFVYFFLSFFIHKNDIIAIMHSMVELECKERCVNPLLVAAL